jgi:hypothetical protein
MNGSGEDKSGEGNSRLNSFYTYKDTFDENNVWVNVPKTVTFLNITDPFNMEPTPEPEYRAASSPIIVAQPEDRHVNSFLHLPYDEAPGLETLSAAATSNFEYLQPLSANMSPPSSNNLNFILNPAGPESSLEISPPIDPALTSLSKTQHGGESSRPVVQHEIAFLLRHFSEVAGQWMDLFDLDCYFAHQVPLQAISNPLLKYSACAYSAKQLGRVRGRKAIIGGLVNKPAEMEIFPHPETVDWAYLGAKYYDRAISLLMEELSHSGRHQDNPATPSIIEDTSSHPRTSQSPHSLPSSQVNKRRRLSRPSHANADDTLAAAAILCVYEFLDNANTAWERHLSGTKSLFDLAEDGMMPLQSPISPSSISQRIKPSRGRKATFWNFARQDFLAAFINEGQTRLNTEDFGLWRVAGLHLDEQGFVMPSNTDDFQYPERQIVMREDMISNALIWLMSKIINYLASGDSIDHVYPQDQSSPTGVIGINQMTLLERWQELEKELNIWYHGLPDTFKPCARLAPVPNASEANDSPRTVFPEIWYSIPMCASTMQSYHMARIILLINKPHESTARRSTVSNRLHSYRAIEAEVQHHSHEICGIALGRPEGSVRIHMVQPLYVAGQCLTDARERRIIVDLLRGIEADLGWATDYRVQQLLKEWGWVIELT